MLLQHIMKTCIEDNLKTPQSIYNQIADSSEIVLPRFVWHNVNVRP